MNENKLLEPSFNRNDCKAGIVHLGVGNFHRAHQALYINKYLEKTNDLNWGIIGVNLRKSESEYFKLLGERKGKYILKTISTNGEENFEEIHSLINLFDWSSDQIDAENVLSNPSIEIVTMTVTESGYYISENNELDLHNEKIKNNLEDKERDIIFSYLVNALKVRKNSCNKAITLLCCDNIRENGKMLEKTLKTYVNKKKEFELLEWINKNVSFPSCMVDRITPRSPDELKEEIFTKFKIREHCSVMAEPFIQWVIEDNFIGKRPKLEKVGVEFVKNVIPYEEIKIRILNAGHVALAYFGVLKGYRTYDEAINDKELEEYFYNIQEKEIIPALGQNLPLDLKEYMQLIHNRFKNKYIGDKLERLVMDGVGKFPIFILPSIKKCFELNILPKFLISSIASWYIFMIKINNKEIAFDYYEPKWSWIKNYLDNDNKFISCKELWGDIPQKYKEFNELLKSEIENLKNRY